MHDRPVERHDPLNAPWHPTGVAFWIVLPSWRTVRRLWHPGAIRRPDERASDDGRAGDDPRPARRANHLAGHRSVPTQSATHLDSALQRALTADRQRLATRAFTPLISCGQSGTASARLARGRFRDSSWNSTCHAWAGSGRAALCRRAWAIADRRSAPLSRTNQLRVLARCPRGPRAGRPRLPGFTLPCSFSAIDTQRVRRTSARTTDCVTRKRLPGAPLRGRLVHLLLGGQTG